MKIKLIAISSCIVLGQAWAASDGVLKDRDRDRDAENRLSRSFSADNDIRRLAIAPKVKTAALPRDDDAASDAPSIGVRGGAASVASRYTASTVSTVNPEKVAALVAKLKDVLAVNADMGEILTGVSGKLGVSGYDEVLPAVDALKAEITKAAGQMGFLAAVLGLEAGQDPLVAVRKEHDALTKLSVILALKEKEDLTAAAIRMKKEHEDEVRALGLKHAAELAGVKATYEADVARLRAEFEEKSLAETKHHAALIEASISAEVQPLNERVAILQAQLNAKIIEANEAIAAANKTAADKVTLEAAYKKDIQTIYLNMLKARREAADAELKLVDKTQEAKHWKAEAFTGRGIFAKRVETYDFTKLPTDLVERLMGLKEILSSQIKDINKLIAGINGETVDSIMRKACDPILSSPLKPAKIAGRLASDGAVAKRLDGALAAAGSGGRL